MMINRESKAVRLLTLTLAGTLVHLAASSCSIGLRTAVAQATADRKVGLFVKPMAAGDEQEALVLQSILRNQVDRLRGVELARTAPIQNKDNVQRASVLADEGGKALLANNIPEALSQFQGAWDLLEQAPGAADDRLLALVMKGIGVAKALSGQLQDAYTYVRRSVLLYDNQSAAEYGYTLDIRGLFERVQQDISTDPAGSVQVTSTPPGAEVYLGGQLRGYTPVMLSNLTAGDQYIEVAKDGYYRWGQFVNVPQGGQNTKDVSLVATPSKPAVDGALADVMKKFKDRDVNAPLMKLQAALGSTELLVLRAQLAGGSFGIDGFYMAQDGAVQKVNVQIARDASLLENLKLFLSTQLASSYEPEPVNGPLSAPAGEDLGAAQGTTGDEGLILDPNAPIFKKTGKGDEESITDQWWFWTLIGVGVAGAVTAIVLPLTLGGEDSGGGGPTGNLSIQLNSY